MSRLSCVHDQTFVRSPDYSCVHDQTFVRSPDYSCVHDQTFVRSPDYSCVHDQTFVRSPDYSCVHDQTFVRSPDYSCVHDQTFVRSPDYSCVHVQTFVRFSLFPDHVNLNARHPRRAFIWVWTYRLSVWDLNLGPPPPESKFALTQANRSPVVLEDFRPAYSAKFVFLLSEGNGNICECAGVDKEDKGNTKNSSGWIAYCLDVTEFHKPIVEAIDCLQTQNNILTFKRCPETDQEFQKCMGKDPKSSSSNLRRFFNTTL